MKQNFYVYEHWRPDLDVCFYVGKGQGRRAYLFRRGEHYNRIIAKLARLGMCVEVRLVASGMTEEEAFSVERERIKFWRAVNVPIINKTEGGEGSSGAACSPEKRAKLRAAQLGRKASATTREKMRKARVGRSIPQVVIDKIRRSMEATYQSEEWRARMGDVHRGKVYNEETRAKIRAARLRQTMPPQTKEQIEKRAIANRGQKRSEETKAKLRAAWVRRRARMLTEA